MAKNLPKFQKQVSPAALRNAEPITKALTKVFLKLLAVGDTVLEIASGSGYHAATLARSMPEFMWQPTDPSAEARASITAHIMESGLVNLKVPLDLDVDANPWPIEAVNAILCINMIHICPWKTTLALFKNAEKRIDVGNPLVTYGPYSLDGDFLADSNIAFDQSLKARNPSWGIRDVKDIALAAKERGFQHDETLQMPANNMMLVFTKSC